MGPAEDKTNNDYSYKSTAEKVIVCILNERIW